VQIAGRPYEDEVVLAVAAAVERDFGYVPPPLS
jgi:Asp-tRNA(Asn)/Glu-tRNA(Gln) amidotransferase A subunit family amidase